MSSSRVDSDLRDRILGRGKYASIGPATDAELTEIWQQRQRARRDSGMPYYSRVVRARFAGDREGVVVAEID